MRLSKSQYIRGIQCPKSLWLYKKKPELREVSEEQESLFKSGISVGDLSRDLFPYGEEIAFDGDDFNGMKEKTKSLIHKGKEVIYEATFIENSIFAMVDILVKNGNVWDVYEVKGSTKVKDYHLNDAAIQWHAVNEALPLNKAYIIHINKSYIKQGALNIHQLFTIEDVTDEVVERQKIIPNILTELKEMLDNDEPNIPIGPHCYDPFACDFHQHCWRDLPSPSVFNLYRMNSHQKFEMYYKDIISYEDIPISMRLNATQKLQVETSKSKKPHIDRPIIQNFLDKVKYPINFFDFETFQNAIPRFEGQRPYMQIPFQYSLHILYEDGWLEHKEFLGDENIDPRKALLEKMLTDITVTGSIVAYNQAFEIARLKELATYSPDKEEEIVELIKRFADLIEPFRKRGYYHPDFNGSFSIKSVLPALFPDTEELNYKNLAIQNGGMAMDTFANLYLLKDPNQLAIIKEDLLAYCRLDTLAMVKIFQRLREICR